MARGLASGSSVDVAKFHDHLGKTLYGLVAVATAEVGSWRRAGERFLFSHIYIYIYFFLRGGQWPAIEGNFQRRCVIFLRGGQWPAIEGNFQRRCVSFCFCFFFKGGAMASHRRELSKKVCVSFLFFLRGGAMASHRRELSKKVCYFFKGGAMASHRRELSKKVC